MNAAPLVRVGRYDTTVSQQSSGLNTNTSIQAKSSCLLSMDEKITSRKRKKQLTSHRLVEKRRRDRINKSLHELRDLIPKLTRTTQTFKNDKVELLQATIDYLNGNTSTKVASQAEGGIQRAEDKFSMCTTKCPEASEEQIDHVSRTDGFRDCMEETIRYLIENEGFPSEHPVILRLRAHLQQRLVLCGQGGASSQMANHMICSSRTIPMVPHGSPAIPTGAVDTSDSALTEIMKPLTVDTRYQYAIPESISQHLTQESQNSNGALNRCLISNNSLLAVVPETNSFMNNNVQCNLQQASQPSSILPSSILYPQQTHGSNCATLTRTGFNLNYVAPYVMAWVRPQQPNMAT